MPENHLIRVLVDGSEHQWPLTTTGLTAVPVVMVIATVLSRALVSLAREVRPMAVAWLALRRTQPNERAEILRALAVDRSRRNRNYPPQAI